jgi:hypothetical protein
MPFVSDIRCFFPHGKCHIPDKLHVSICQTKIDCSILSTLVRAKKENNMGITEGRKEEASGINRNILEMAFLCTKVQFVSQNVFFSYHKPTNGDARKYLIP